MKELEKPVKLYLPLLAYGGEFLFSKGGFPEWAVFLYVYGLLLWFILANIKGRGFWPYWIGAGTLMNFAVIAANGFRMPVWASLGSAGSSVLAGRISKGDFFGYTLVDEGTKLPFLADGIGVSLAGDLVGFASIGDILLVIGVIVLVTRIFSAK